MPRKPPPTIAHGRAAIDPIQIISRRDAEAQRSGFLSAPLRLCVRLLSGLRPLGDLRLDRAAQARDVYFQCRRALRVPQQVVVDAQSPAAEGEVVAVQLDGPDQFKSLRM